MLSRRIPMLAILAASALSLAAVAAKAGAPCVGQCYEKVATPPSVGVVEEQVMVSPGRIVAYQTPAQFAVVPNPKTIIPEHIVARYAPAKFATVTEEVMISPPGKRWEVTRDASGREIGCWVETPAKFVTRQRSVMIKPPVTLYHRVRQVADMQPAICDGAAARDQPRNHSARVRSPPARS